VKPVLVLCLGNDLVTDDAFGPTVASRLENQVWPDDNVEVLFAPVAGFALLDLLNNRQAVLVVDAIFTGEAEPGTLHFFEAGNLAPTRGLVTSHQMNLPTALKFGREMKIAMPESIDVLAVEVEDVETLSEELTPRVSSAVPEAIKKIEKWVSLQCQEESYDQRKVLT